MLAEGKLPIDQGSNSGTTTTNPQQGQDMLQASLAMDTGNIGPKEQLERATRSGFASWALWSIAALGHILSPAALRGEDTSSRATRGPPNSGILAGRIVMQVLQIPRENMNTLASGNPTLAVRASLSSSNIAGFQLSQLHVEENIARLAWERTSTAIGAGLFRSELYVSSRETCQAVIHPKTYEALRPSLKSMSLQQLLSTLSLHRGPVPSHRRRP